MSDSERSGSFNSQEENNPNVTVVMQHVQTLVDQVNAMNVQSQQEARAFIQENGAQVVGGHSPVNPADNSFMNPAPGNPAPEYPPGLNTFDLQNAYVAPETTQSAPTANDALMHPANPSAPPLVDAGED